MNVSPTLEYHPHQEFHFADDTESEGCCCFWKSKPAKPKEYVVDKDNRLHGRQKCNVRERIAANERLGNLVRQKFDPDPIENDKAYERLRLKINDQFEGEPITEERLTKIIGAIYELKREFSQTTVGIPRLKGKWNVHEDDSDE